jgi:hypothetical protein
MTPARGLVVILFACSGVMAGAFQRHGWDTLEVDAKPAEGAGDHWRGDVFDFLSTREFARARLVILHPPCTYLAISGVARWNGVNHGRELCSRWALHQTRRLFDALGQRRFVLENPASLIGTKIRPATCSVHPFMFGDDASKLTCLWMGGGLPRLVPPPRKLWHPGRLVADPKSGRLVRRWSNQTASGAPRQGPSPTRAADRARTYPGIAAALAEQMTAAIDGELPFDFEHERVFA